MGASMGSGGGPMADINVTPLIDVVLVLLVVFMVITPMLQSGMNVDLPKATQTTTVNDVGQHIVVSVTAQGTWWVEQTEVDEVTIIDVINEEYRKSDIARSIMIKADKGLEYGAVREVMDVLAEQNMTTLLIAAEQEG